MAVGGQRGVGATSSVVEDVRPVLAEGDPDAGYDYEFA